ncbi:protein of unknown function [Acidithiobacillus ferrivorans]|uniref:Uncharacterized protein n=1 Tax=Acidithiobacillus ferrivorans TaxID=160808 RepID=A0A060UUZ3_9PROT|nr:hypothetical protein AFERRI_90007 [Acidithiobacillus ferrivorans]SMH66511.1 protein of unknown function [Acidithiobacillus ferrivorans]
MAYFITSRIGYRGRDPHVADSSVTESDVRIVVHVHNVFIIFVLGSAPIRNRSISDRCTQNTVTGA